MNAVSRQSFALLLAAAMVAPACVLPGEFDDVDQSCPAPSFDAPTRDAFCSGTVERTRFVQGSAELVTFEDADDTDPFVQIIGDRFMTSVRPVSQGLAVKVLERTDDEGVVPRLVERIDIPDLDERNITSVATMSVEDAGSGITASLAVVLNEETLTFLRVSDIDDQPGSAEAPEPAIDGDGGDDGDVFLDDQPTLPAVAPYHRRQVYETISDELKARCAEDDFRFKDVAAVRSGNRNFVMVAAGCGVIAYPENPTAYRPVFEAQQDALSIAVDNDNRRLFVASGKGGLKVRAIDEITDNLPDDNRGAAFDASGGGDGAPEGGESPDYEYWFDLGEWGDAADPIDGVAVNVTQVSFADNRVFYLNQASGDDGLDAVTFLVSGRLNSERQLEERTSRAFPYNDFALARDGIAVSYQLVSLEDTMLAVLRQSDDGVREVTVFDAPENHRPTPVYLPELDDAHEIIKIDQRGDELWVVYNDHVEAFRITVGGAPR